MTQVATQPPLDAAQTAFARHAWREAADAFAEADAAGGLGPAELESYAEAAWWLGRTEMGLGLRERVFAARNEARDRRGAARAALRLFLENAMKLAFNVAQAWLATAERLLENDVDSAEYGVLRFMRSRVAGGQGDPDTALSEARAALEIGERFGDRDLQALALSQQGMALITKGEARSGMALVDEATAAAVSGELSLMTTGTVYCQAIAACRDLADFRRSSEWTDAAIRWCERQSVTGFPGICRVHRAEILALRGALAKAEQEARLASEELAQWNMQVIIGESFNEIGLIRLRIGDLPAAEAAFRQAHEMGRTPEPGLSLVRLAEGKAANANASLRRALADEQSRPERARLLPAQVQAAVAAGDLVTARTAAAELEEIAATFDTLALKASARAARGELVLAEGQLEAAQREGRLALDLWHQLDAPYEAAQARVLVARAARAAGDEDTAQLELAAAKATFERIGARRDARAVAAALGEGSETAPSPEGPRVTRTFLFTDIVDSTKLIGVIGDTAWQDLIRWHDDTLRTLIAEHGGEEIRSQGDGLVVAFDSADAAIDCAIAIQRRLAAQRRAQGFAPAVRIGIHRAEATQRGLDYSGVGMHEAARVGALAGGGEILVTRATLRVAKQSLVTGEPRTVELKGIAEPIEVQSVRW